MLRTNEKIIYFNLNTGCLCRVERAAGNLLKDAASVLVYQSVLTGPPAQALLKLLLALRRSDGQ